MIKISKLYNVLDKLILKILKIIFSDWTSRIIGIVISFILLRDYNIDRNYQPILIIIITFIVVNIIDFSIRTPVFFFTRKHFAQKIDEQNPNYLNDNFNCCLNINDINYNESLKSIKILSFSKNFFRIQLNQYKIIMIPYYFEEMNISEKIDMSFILFFSFNKRDKIRQIPDSIKKYIFLKIIFVEKIILLK